MPCYEWSNSCQIIQRHFVRFNERETCAQRSAHQEVTQKSVTFCEADKNCGLFCPINGQMVIYGPSSQIVSNFHGRRRDLFQDCWQYCFYYNVYRCGKALNHSGEGNFFTTAMKRTGRQALETLQHTTRRGSSGQTLPGDETLCHWRTMNIPKEMHKNRTSSLMTLVCT